MWMAKVDVAEVRHSGHTGIDGFHQQLLPGVQAGYKMALEIQQKLVELALIGPHG
jgi:hypothetical protein